MTELNMQQAEISRIMDMIDEYHAVLNDDSGLQEAMMIMRHDARQWLRNAIERIVIDRDGWHAEYGRLLKTMHRGAVVLGSIEGEIKQ